MINYYTVFWSWRDYYINTIVSENDYKLLSNNLEITIIIKNFYSYCNDEHFNSSMFSFELIKDDIELVKKYHPQHNNEIIEELIKKIKLTKEDNYDYSLVY